MPVDQNDAAELEIVIAAVKSVMEAIAGIGIVHGYRRYANTQQGFQSLFVNSDTKKLLGWMISRESTQSMQTGVDFVEDQHTIVIRGYQAVEDEKSSEQDFQSLVETVRATFRSNRTLGTVVQWSDPMQVRTVMMASFGNFLCHYCELVLVVKPNPVVF